MNGPSQAHEFECLAIGMVLQYPVAEWVVVKGSHAQPESWNFQSHPLLPPTAQSHTQYRIQGRRFFHGRQTLGTNCPSKSLERNLGHCLATRQNKQNIGARSNEHRGPQHGIPGPLGLEQKQAESLWDRRLSSLGVFPNTQLTTVFALCWLTGDFLLLDLSTSF